MSTVKTAISLDEGLFEKAECMAKDMCISRSRLVTVALEEFIRRHENRQILDGINAAHGSPFDASETQHAEAMRRRRRRAGGEW